MPYFEWPCATSKCNNTISTAFQKYCSKCKRARARRKVRGGAR